MEVHTRVRAAGDATVDAMSRAAVPMPTTASDAAIRRAVAALRVGELVAFPTETVYGLGADAMNPDAVRRIFAAKGRQADHPVIVHLLDAAQLAYWARTVSPVAAALARHFWPGPLTLILPRASSVPDAVTGGQDTVGLRVPSHPVARALLAAFGGGIAGPSANRFGRLSPTCAADVRAELGAAVALVLEGGASEVGIESAIVDCSGAEPALLRPGMIGADAIAAVLGRPLASATRSSPRVPGMLRSHYAPQTPVSIVNADELRRRVRDEAADIGVLALRPAPPAFDPARWVEAAAEPAAYARELYAQLRRLDALGCRQLLVEAVPDTAPWTAIRDRLARSAA